MAVVRRVIIMRRLLLLLLVVGILRQHKQRPDKSRRLNGKWQFLWDTYSPHSLVDPVDVPAVLDALVTRTINRLSTVYRAIDFFAMIIIIIMLMIGERGCGNFFGSLRSRRGGIGTVSSSYPSSPPRFSFVGRQMYWFSRGRPRSVPFGQAH